MVAAATVPSTSRNATPARGRRCATSRVDVRPTAPTLRPRTSRPAGRVMIMAADRPPRMPRDPQDLERDSEADEWVGALKADRADRRAEAHREAHVPVRARVVAVRDQRRAVQAA